MKGGPTGEDRRVATPLDPTALGFLMAENRRMPMHVGGLQLYKKPEGAGHNYVRELFEEARDTTDIAPLFLKHPYRSIKTAGQWMWVEDDQFDIEHHVRHSALPKPGRVRGCSSSSRGCTAPGSRPNVPCGSGT